MGCLKRRTVIAIRHKAIVPAKMSVVFINHYHTRHERVTRRYGISMLALPTYTHIHVGAVDQIASSCSGVFVFA